MTVQQGDQYSLPITIRMGDGYVTPDTVTGLRLSVAGIEQRYPGTLDYDAPSNAWLFPLTQEQTLQMQGHVTIQAQANLGGSPAVIIGSGTTSEQVAESIIRSVWDD